ncbi:hypothetical protein BH20BAC1_BH20BAC1_24290 [soil metagenome]
MISFLSVWLGGFNFINFLQNGVITSNPRTELNTSLLC